MKKYLWMLFGACILSGCQTANKAVSPTPQHVIDGLVWAEKLTDNNQAAAGLALILPYGENNYSDGSVELTLGYIYQKGLNDMGKGIEWYKKSAKKGNKGATYNLGNIYYSIHDYDRAYDYYSDSLELGNSAANTQLGQLYYYGNGVKRDYSKAVQYFELGKTGGDPIAYYYLGLCYLNSYGVAQDLNKAHALLTYAAKAGNQAAIKELRELGWL